MSVLNYSCNAYRPLHKIQSDESCIHTFIPDFNHVIYKTSVDVTGKEITGLLVIKKMTDSNTRIAFFSQTGLSFFDFEFLPDNHFNVISILPEMNKKAFIKTLRKDFELVMFRNMDSSTYYSLAGNGLIYHAYPQSKGINYYITDSLCLKLVRMQRASNKKPVMEAFMFSNPAENVPDSILMHHLNFKLTISLKKITALASE